MKKKLLFAPIFLFSVILSTAQDTTMRKTQSTQGNNKNTQTHNRNNANTNRTTMQSTGRYSALGVTTGSLHRKDMKFIMLAASSNHMELELARLAQQNAASQEVKDFAEMILRDHTAAGVEMKTMLSKKGTMIPDTAMLPKHRIHIDHLRGLQGAEFDRAYIGMMVDAHEDDIDEYEDETTDARDADIRAFARKTLPVLQKHHTRAKEIRKSL